VAKNKQLKQQGKGNKPNRVYNVVVFEWIDENINRRKRL
jgi:hypothetical protein